MSDHKLPPVLRFGKIHGPVLLGLAAVVFAAFGRLTTGDFWHALDYYVLADAHNLAHDPWQMFGHIGAYFSQILLQLAFLAEYRLFGLHFGGYIAVNLVVHTLNAFIVYMLVNLLYYRPRMAFVAAVLFALGVGHWGRILMTAHNLEGLLLGFFHLLVLYLFIRNDVRRKGRIRSVYFLVGLAVYGLAGLTKASTLAILGCLVAYKTFFYVKRERRPVLSTDLIIFLAVGLLFQIGAGLYAYEGPSVQVSDPGPVTYTWLSIKNVFRYLNLMLLPIRQSELLAVSHPLIQAIFEFRVAINPLLTLAIFSFSVFGFVFGNSPLRFFIAWTYITLIPYSGTRASGAWLDLNHLYVASLGLCVALSAGAFGTFNLLRQRRWRRWLAFAIPAAYACIAVLLVHRLDDRNRRLARSPEMLETRRALEEFMEAPPGTGPARLGDRD